MKANVKLQVEEPVWDDVNGWSCPSGYKFQYCPTCERNYRTLKPVLSKGGTSCPGPICSQCESKDYLESK
jgi:hypothetical protein